MAISKDYTHNEHDDRTLEDYLNERETMKIHNVKNQKPSKSKTRYLAYSGGWCIALWNGQRFTEDWGELLNVNFWCELPKDPRPTSESKYKHHKVFHHKSTGEILTIVNRPTWDINEGWMYECSNNITYSEFEIDEHLKK